jgi:cell division septation protein DedD
MKKTIFLILMIILACVFGRQIIFAQTGVSLEAEIQNMEKTVKKQGVTPAQRHETLVRLARLKQLSGDIEGAAKNWFEAAAAIPGSVDDDALLACAGCLAAMGEWDRASAALEPLVPKIQRARFLNTVIKSIQSGDASALAALADNPQFSQMKSEIYFMLWKISKGQTAESWRGKLLDEYPQSPEGRLAAGESSSTITVRPSPFWLFASGLDSLPLTAETYTAVKPQDAAKPKSTPAAAQASAPAQTVVSQATAPSVQPQNSTPKASTPVPATGTKLQTGKYSRQVNADNQMDKLRLAGFTPFMEKRDEYWFVMVPAGTDQKQTIKELKEAGFDSFPVK